MSSRRRAGRSNDAAERIRQRDCSAGGGAVPAGGDMTSRMWCPDWDEDIVVEGQSAWCSDGNHGVIPVSGVTAYYQRGYWWCAHHATIGSVYGKAIVSLNSRGKLVTTDPATRS